MFLPDFCKLVMADVCIEIVFLWPGLLGLLIEGIPLSTAGRATVGGLMVSLVG